MGEAFCRIVRLMGPVVAVTMGVQGVVAMSAAANSGSVAQDPVERESPGLAGVFVNKLEACIEVKSQSDFSAGEKTIVEVEVEALKPIRECGCKSRKIQISIKDPKGKILKSKSVREKREPTYTIELPEISTHLLKTNGNGQKPKTHLECAA